MSKNMKFITFWKGKGNSWFPDPYWSKYFKSPV